MNQKDLERKLESAYRALSAPDVLDRVLSDCNNEKGAILMMHDRKKTRHPGRWAGIAAAFALLLCGGLGYRAYNTVDATVSLDVNPSIELQTNRKDRVLHVTAHNADGEILLGDMDFSGSNLDVAINALIGSMVRNGYLNELANSLLLSVDCADPARSAELEARLTQEISALLQTDAFSGAVLSQTIDQDTALTSTADQYGITLGKAQLIQEIIDQNTGYDFDTLATLSINELSLLHHENDHQHHQVEATGITSDKAYIGTDAAKTAALAHAGIAESDARSLQIEYDYEWGAMVYEVEFHAEGYEFSIDIDALTGEILNQEKEREDDALEPVSDALEAVYDALEDPCDDNLMDWDDWDDHHDDHHDHDDD